MKEISFNTLVAYEKGIHLYSIFALVGFGCAMVLYIILLYKRSLLSQKSLTLIIIAILTTILGAKLLGILVNFLISIYQQETLTFDIIFKSGITYYGGLFGFLSGVYIGHFKLLKKKICGYKDVIAVVIPLFHTFGRIGCFCAGCCYGKVTNGDMGIYYTYIKSGVQVTEYIIPIQLIEAVANFAIFIMLLMLFIFRKMYNKLLYVYFILYSITRFILEFYRGDSLRGVYYGVSTSQIISLGILTYVIVISMVSGITIKNRRKDNE